MCVIYMYMLHVMYMYMYMYVHAADAFLGRLARTGRKARCISIEHLWLNPFRATEIRCALRPSPTDRLSLAQAP